MEHNLTANELEEIQTGMRLIEFQNSIINQVKNLPEFTLPDKYLPNFNLIKAINLYYEAYKFSMNDGIGNYTSAINDAIMKIVEVEDNENKFICQNPYYMEGNILHLTSISTFISKACEAVSNLQFTN